MKKAFLIGAIALGMVAGIIAPKVKITFVEDSAEAGNGKNGGGRRGD